MRCGEIRIEPVNIEEYGWKWEESEKLMVPVWYEGEQPPSSLRRSPKKRRKRVNAKSEADNEISDGKGEEGDVELNTASQEEEEMSQPRRRKSKRRAASRYDSKVTHSEAIPSSDTSQADVNKIIVDENEHMILSGVDDNMGDCSADTTPYVGESDWEVSDFDSTGDSDNDDEWIQ